MTTGRTTTVLVVGVVGSWCGQVPMVALLVTFWEPSLRAVFLGVSVGYAIACVGLGAALVRLDWSVLAQEAEARANIGTAPAVASQEEQEAAQTADARLTVMLADDADAQRPATAE